MKTKALLSVAISALATVATVAVANAATITFEEAIPGPGMVTNQYCRSAALNQGVLFLICMDCGFTKCRRSPAG